MHFYKLTEESKDLNFDTLGSGVAAGRSFKVMTHTFFKDLFIFKIDGIDDMFSVDVPSIVEDIIKAQE